MFYNLEGDIIVQKSDIDIEDEVSVTSDTSSTSSGSRRRLYRSRTRKEKQKKRHGPKGNIKAITWWDDHVPDPAAEFESRIQGVPSDMESELKRLIPDSSEMALADTNPVTGTENGETINNTFRKPIDSETGATGTLIEDDGVLYVQKYLHGKYYY